MNLIDKSALVAEIERRIKSLHQVNSPREQAVLYECEDILSFIDTLEVKGVDLEKELDEWMRYGPHTNYPWCTIPDAIKITAEHFFELGIAVSNKVQKGK